MGCIMEFFFELIIEGIMSVYMYLMLLILPEDKQNEKAKKTVRTIATVFSVLLLFCLFIGIVLLFETHGNLNTIGFFLTVIPLVIIVLQIILGIILRFSKKVR